MTQGNCDPKMLVEWLNSMLPQLRLSAEISEEELRACFVDGTVLCSVLNKLCPGSVETGVGLDSGRENIQRFLAAMDELGLPSFHTSDLEQGSMEPVLQCLGTLKSAFDFGDGEEIEICTRKKWDLSEVESLGSAHGQNNIPNGEEGGRPALQNLVIPEQLGQKLHEVLKQSHYTDFSDASILEFIDLHKFDNTPTQALLDIVDQILLQSIENKNEDVSNRVAYALRKIIQVIEQRISNQANSLKKQSNFFKAREEKIQTKLRALESLAVGTSEENEVVLDQLQRLKLEKLRLEETKKLEEKGYERIMKEKEDYEYEISRLREELLSTKNAHKIHCLQLEEDAKEMKLETEKKYKKYETELMDSKKKVKEAESFAETKIKRLRRKERTYQSFLKVQSGALQELRDALESTKSEVLKTKRNGFEQLNYLGSKLKGLADAAANYHVVLAENRKLYNEVQDLKGNIRVYCRIRPFLPGQSKKLTTIDYVGENGEIIIANPSKQGSHRPFKFNKVFGPTTTQEEVFLDTQPLIRSVLDGYNVCIFAYGQTGSGKTYTMSGPSMTSTADWGVNYRALHDLFQISQSRKNSIVYEVGAQMVEIYNEQVRDLLSNEISQKRLGIWTTAQPNGLAVPDASMHSVKSTEDVLELMNIGLMNRAVGATALNERSSRSHSVLTVHVRGTDLKTNTVLRGSLHLVDLAGSERVDRSEATGDRLREAQHINKSLSALGDVIFALAQKSSHVPYRNSKLTQVLQSSLGGQAKTLMFVQLNPDVESYSETVSTLKFAERVSGVELGAARSNKEGRDVRDLMEQVAALKDTVAKKDDEIEQLQKNNGHNGLRCSTTAFRYASSSPVRHSAITPRRTHRLSSERRSNSGDTENCSEHSETGSQHSVEDLRQYTECSVQPRVVGDSNQSLNEDAELLGFGDADSDERLSDISDGGLSMGTETDGSISSVVEYTLFPEGAKLLDPLKSEKTRVMIGQMERSQSEITDKSTFPSKLPKPPQRTVSLKSSRPSVSRSTSKLSTGPRKPTPIIASSSSAMAASRSSKRWQ